MGLPHPSQQLSIPAVSLVAEERTLRGSYLGSGPELQLAHGRFRYFRPDELEVVR